MQIRDPEAVRKVVASASKQSPVADDAKFSIVRDAEIGSPVMVYTPEGEPSFWMVPFVLKNSACGFAYVELSGKVSKFGIFGSTPEDHSSWIDASFFKKPPDAIIVEIQAKFSGLTISKPVFSYDTSPARWAWRIEVKNKIRTIIFITPGGWYERPSEEKDISWEE